MSINDKRCTHRFGEKDAEKGRIALAAMEKKNAQYRSLIQSQREVVHEEEEVVDLLAPIKDTFNLNDYVSFIYTLYFSLINLTPFNRSM